MLPVATAPLLQASITFTNTYINTLHTIAGLGGRLPTEAQLTVMSQNSRKGAGLPEMCSMGSLLPKSPPSPFQGLVCPIWRVAIGGFGGLRLGLQGAGLATLTRATRGILRQVVVQQLGVRLLVGRHNVQERGRRIARGCSRGQGPSGAQGRGQAEWWRSPCVKSLLVKSL